MCKNLLESAFKGVVKSAGQLTLKNKKRKIKITEANGKEPEKKREKREKKVFSFKRKM